jgi:hypothetical protein
VTSAVRRGGSRHSQSRKTTLSRELLIFKPPLYSMNPSFRNLFMKKFTRERVVPTISASVSCDSRELAMGCFGLTVARQQQQRAGEALLARVEQLINQVFFNADVSGQHVAQETIRECRPGRSP